MSTEDPGAAGIIVIRLWTESEGGVRVRVTSSTDLRQESVRSAVVSSRGEVVRLVEQWLDQVLGPVTRS
jgi:hypothetical protein